MSVSKEHNVVWEDWFYYDETSHTSLRWKVDRKCGADYLRNIVSAGDPAGAVSGEDGHFAVILEGKKYKVHRIIWELHFGTIAPRLVVDHKDGNPQNNRPDNLRIVSQARNARNARKKTNNTSGVNGVNRTVSGKRSYWTARWMEGKIRSKHFSIENLGNDEAFRQACEFRAVKIEELNKQGAGYTERHGG